MDKKSCIARLFLFNDTSSCFYSGQELVSLAENGKNIYTLSIAYTV